MKGVPEVITIDFETKAIGPRPEEYPPVPVGVALRVPGENPEYLAWGHPTKNNTTKEKATARLWRLWNSGTPLLFHNAKFDYDVATTHLGMPELPWDRLHDTLFLIFLQDPNRKTLSLKPVAEAVLKLPPNERDAVREWLVANGVVKANDRKWGAFISAAPGDLVGKYAVGDVDRTYRLFAKYYHEVVVKRKMAEAYDRERELMPELLASERHGVLLDNKTLSADVERYSAAFEATDEWLRKRLKAPDLNVDSDQELGKRIQELGLGDEANWERTETGNLSVSKEALDGALTDRALAGALVYRGVLATCLRTFMIPWNATATRTKGLIYTSWNQVAQDYHESGAKKGTRTGRLSSVPNFQNIPNKFEEKPIIMRGLASALKVAALRKIIEACPLPEVRSYIVAPRGSVLLKRDYSQQELRILAHYEDGALLSAYREDPWLDMHVFVQNLINSLLGTNLGRKPIKALNFGLIYGMGIGKTAADMGLEVEMAKRVKSAHKQGFPGIDELMKEMKYRAKAGQPIRTWGGREYFCEEPREIKGRLVHFDYKLINTLIQGSAADNTKQAMVNYGRRKRAGDLQGNLLINVHDELLAEAKKADRVREMRGLRDAMQDVSFDLPMLSTGGYGTRWNAITDLPRGE